MMTAISHDTPESKVLVSRLLELCSTKLNHIIHVTIYENPRERERGVVEGANAEEASVSLLWTGMAQDTTCRHMQFHCWVRNTWSWYQVQLLRANSSYYQLSHSASTALPRASSCSYNDRWNPSQFSNMATATDPHISYLIIDQSEDHKKWTHPEQLWNSCLYSRRHQQITIQL